MQEHFALQQPSWALNQTSEIVRAAGVRSWRVLAVSGRLPSDRFRVDGLRKRAVLRSAGELGAYTEGRTFRLLLGRDLTWSERWLR